MGWLADRLLQTTARFGSLMTTGLQTHQAHFEGKPSEEETH